MNNYDQLVTRLSESANIEKEEVERKVEAKRAKLSGLISKEGAAQIVAAELGISFENERMKLSELADGMKRAHVLGKVTQVYPVREFSKNGREGKIGSFLLGDDSSNVRVVLWDMSHIALIEEGKIKDGSVLEITNGNIRNGEMHLSAFSDIKNSKEKIDDVMTKRAFGEGKIMDAGPGKSIKARAVIVQIFDPKYFEDKNNPGLKRALLNVVLDDGTATTRCVLFGDMIYKLGFNEEEVFSIEKFNEKKGSVLGEEKIFSGNFRTNTYVNALEMNVDNIEDVDTDVLVKELEASS